MRDRFETRALSSAFSRKSLFFAEESDWRWQRRAAAPAFRHEKLLELVPIFAHGALAQAQEWQSIANGAIIDVALAMRKLTVAIILQAALVRAHGDAGSAKIPCRAEPQGVDQLAVSLRQDGTTRGDAVSGLGARRRQPVAGLAKRYHGSSRTGALKAGSRRTFWRCSFRERSGNGAHHERRRTDLQPIHVHGRRSRDHGDGAGMDFMAACEGSGRPRSECERRSRRSSASTWSIPSISID